jgi:tyrosine decarboxylase/aspartate 1-decarboxylase
MKSKGRSKKDVMAELQRTFEEDSKYEQGRILCSMCTKPQPLAKVAHQMFLSSNLGDAGLFRGSRKLEQHVIQSLAELLNGKNSCGLIVSGGTEANLLALWTARNSSNVKEPEVILPESAHFSLNKICDILKLKPIWAELDIEQRVVPKSIEQNITKNTVAIVGTAGTAELGVVDPIPELSKIALKYNVHLHVDAAFGGLLIPFLDLAEQKKLEFDFQLEGVKSITVDPHKMGMSTIPAGSILFRDQNSLNWIRTETPYLTEKEQCTFIGTRSGASVAAAWTVFALLGREGFEKTVKDCMRLTRFLSKEILAHGLELVIKPTLNVVAFRTDNSKKTVEDLRRQGWFVSYVPRLDCVRAVLMPHLKKQHIYSLMLELFKNSK